MLKKSKTKKRIETNYELLNSITPIGLEFKNTSVRIGDNYGKIFGIIRYPSNPKYGWLEELTKLKNTIITISFKSIDNSVLLESLNTTVRQQGIIAESANKEVDRQRAKKINEDSKKLIKNIDQLGDTVGLMGVLLMPISPSKEETEKLSTQIKSRVANLGGRVRLMASMQEEAFKTITPYYTVAEEIENAIHKIVPISSFIGGYPFSNQSYTDETGYYLGRAIGGGFTIIDFWNRQEDRTNSNILATGISGTGKSTFIKHIAISEYMLGTKIIFIDPESEYKELCNSLDGSWINVGGGGGAINPLQIYDLPTAEDEIEDIKMNPLALHIQFLQTFFSLYSESIGPEEMAVLKRELINLYKDFDITFEKTVDEILDLDSTDYPRLIDLYEKIEKNKKKTTSDHETDIYNRVLLLLEDISKGADSHLWNKTTNINTNNQCICFDTNSLQNSPDNIKKTQYFNILAYAWKILSENRKEKVMIFCDEAYFMINDKIPQSLTFLNTTMKRARKYEGSLVVISQSVLDFLGDKIQKEGETLLTQPSYKFFFGTEGKDLKNLEELYNMTEFEEELLLKKQKGQCLAIIGSKRIGIDLFEKIPDYKFEYFGEAGGR